jgi:glucose 1-dehydrogenase
MIADFEKGKVAVVTGSSKGIRKAIAVALAKENYRLIINARKAKKAEEVAGEIRSMGKIAFASEADVSRERDCIFLIDSSIKKFGRIDLLVNNAGIQGAVSISEMSVDEWDNVLNVNLRGAFICSREAVKHMLKVGKGCIINISSVHQIIPKPLFAHYAASKGGIEMLTKSMALELARKGIRVNAVAPGAISTDMNRKLLSNKDKLQDMIDQIPMGRIGEPNDVADLVVYLASEKAMYITGSTFFVDGGLTLYPTFCVDCETRFPYLRCINWNN